VSNVVNTCEMVNCNVLNDVSKCYYVAEMDEINIISYHIISFQFVLMILKLMSPVQGI
jgi:hypothetical protein